MYFKQRKALVYNNKMETPLTPYFKANKNSKFLRFFGHSMVFRQDETGSVTKAKVLQWPKIIMLISALIGCTPFVMIMVLNRIQGMSFTVLINVRPIPIPK